MNHSKFSRLLAAVTSLTLLGGMLPAYQPDAVLTAYAEDSAAEAASDAPANPDSAETEKDYAVRSASVRFDLNGGSLQDEKFTVSEGIAVLKDEADPADAPEPEAPALSNLAFAGWTTASGAVVSAFEADTTYYASWVYNSGFSTNPNSGLVNYIEHGYFYDFLGNNGTLRTTYANTGYDIYYRLGDTVNNISKGGYTATYVVSSGLAVTPVFSFCDCNGNVSENPEDNLYTKVSYLIQNRTDADIDNFGLASTADVQIGGNDHAAIYAYSDDDTQLTASNYAEYQVKNVEMRDGSGNIFMLSLPEDAKCWWGYYGSRGGYAFSDHSNSNYSVGYDSGIAYSWSGLSIPAGETVEKSVIFAVGDIHLFKTHAFNADGICIGGSGCPLAADHTAETPVFFQKPQRFEENGNTRYEVRNAGQLMWLSQNINSGDVAGNVNIELVNDIRFNMNLTEQEDGSYTVSDTLAWTPIGTFSGQFDGKGHTVSGISCKDSTACGLFGTLDGATVQNVGIANSVFASDAPAGSVAASAENGTVVRNVFSTAAVSGEQAGGLLYNVDASSVSASYFAGSGTELLCKTDNENASFDKVYILSDDADTPFAAAAADFASGKVANSLGSAWSQDLANDQAFPYLGSDLNVYSYTENRSCSPSNPKPLTHYTNDSAMSGKTLTVEHVMDWGRVVKQANCTENERWNKKCKNCEYETSELFDRGDDGQKATGHNHDTSGYCQNICKHQLSKISMQSFPIILYLKGNSTMIDALYNYRQGDIHSAEFSDEFNALCIPFEDPLNEEQIDSFHKILDCVSDTAAAEMRAAYKAGFKDGVILMGEIQQ